MAEPFLGEIRIFAGNFAPRSWAFCEGQLLSKSQNTALFNLIGTTYGGNGVTTFALPDLRGRIPVGPGQGPGLTDRPLGAADGTETVVLSEDQMPTHKHKVGANQLAGSTPNPKKAVPAGGGAYVPQPDNTKMNAGAVGSTGGGGPHPNLQPYLNLHFIIALQGIFPTAG
jgi:microcystin-dependent protein